MNYLLSQTGTLHKFNKCSNSRIIGNGKIYNTEKEAKQSGEYIKYCHICFRQKVYEQKIRKEFTADEIKKFKNLLDIGAITQQEYERKKAELLGM